MSEGETKTITGQCTAIEEKNGWTAFSIDTGSQYPTRLSTKLEKLIAEARGVGQQLATWTYKESESDKVNPNSGQPYKNRYLEKVEVGGSAPASGNGQLEAHHEPMHYADKDRAITRMACLKAAAEMLRLKDGTLEEQISDTLTAANRFEIWVMRDIDPVPFD